jgi:hypothetical protein
MAPDGRLPLDAILNCLYTAFATDNALHENLGLPRHAQRWWEWAAPPAETVSPRGYLRGYRDRDPVDVAGYAQVVDAMRRAGHGARAIVVVDTRESTFAHRLFVPASGRWLQVGRR